jgi:hypothetical protein
MVVVPSANKMRDASFMDRRGASDRFQSSESFTTSSLWRSDALDRSDSGYIADMKKSLRVVFQPKRISETDWQIEAAIPGAEIRIITGLTSKADVDDWMSGNRKVAWLRSQGYAK